VIGEERALGTTEAVEINEDHIEAIMANNTEKMNVVLEVVNIKIKLLS
jgi:hypothetical protein